MRARFKRTTLITIFCLAVLAGLGLARRLNLQPQIWWLLFTPVAILFIKKNYATLALVLAVGLCLGLWRGGIYMDKVRTLQSYTLRQVTIQTTATSDAVYAAKSQLEFTGNNVKLLSPNQEPLAGSFKISGFGVHMVYRGDTVQVSGKLYPMRGSNQARIAYAQLQTVGTDNSWINRLTRNFDAGMQNALPEPQASFGLGLLIGQRTTLPTDILAALTAVGLVHIVAVSGYNLTIMVQAAERLKLSSKYQQLILSLSLITGFILITGFSASIVRAAIVSVLTLWAWYYGRKIRPIVLITFAAALTGLFNPFYVWGDLGWYLSFLAFFGVLVIAPIITVRFFKKKPKLLTLVLIETLSAEVMTLPLIMMTFSQLSLIALVANILVVPLVPLAMLLTAIAGVAGMIIPNLCGWFAWPARVILTYMLDLVHILSSIPSVLVRATISPEIMIGCYGLVISVTLIAWHRIKTRSVIITDKKPLNIQEKM